MASSIKNAPARGLLVSLIAALAVFSCDNPANGGNTTPGTAATITISSAADLAKIGKNSAFPLTGEYTLSADITVTNWVPIGDSAAPFTGVFDGAHKTLTITSGTGGLFGRTKGAVVQNVTVGGSINRPAGVDEFAGGVAGYAENTRIESCKSTVNITLMGSGHNASAGGITGYMRGTSVVSGCEASGTITLQSEKTLEWMVYAGGIAGYSTGTECAISRCVSSATVSAAGGYPYSGGVAGYNFSGASITESAALGAVTAEGGFLPYAGGIAGYNSGESSLVENCYYDGAGITARSDSKGALAGGIAGANASGAIISKCYAACPVTVEVTGNVGSFQGNGVPLAGNVGGIAGAQYVLSPVIQNCAALNTTLTGTDLGAGATLYIYRIAGGSEGSPKWENNIAISMTITVTGTRTPDPGENKKDGANCESQPIQAVYESMQWDFIKVWKMEGDFPKLVHSGADRQPAASTGS